MTIFEKNMEALLKMSPAAAEIIRGSEARQDFDIFPSSSGALTCSINGKLVHSRQNPEREAERLVTSSTDSGSSFFIFLGFGLGYAVEACRRLFPDCKIIIIIPDTGLFAEVCRQRDITHLLKDPAVRFAFKPDPPEIPLILSDIHGLDYTVLRNRGITGCYEGYFRKIDEAITSFRSKQEINRNTLIRFGRRWVNNLLHNMHLLLESGNIAELSGLFADIPCLLLAAGPSLDDISEDLPLWREKGLIVAVDTAAICCARAGIEPDFLVVVDPQFWNSCYLEGLGFEKTILVSESSTHPRVFRLLPLQTYFCGSLFPLGKYLEGYIGERGPLGAGGSVATTAWDFARMLGCASVYCAGLDLGFPRMRTHYKGSFFEELVHSAESRLDPGEGRIFSYTYGAGPFPAENYSGGHTLTDKRLILYKWWFEGQARTGAHEGCLTYVLSGESVKIEGFESADPGLVSEMKPVRQEIENILAPVRRPRENSLHCRSGIIRDKKKAKLAEGCRRLINELRALGECADRGVKGVRKLRESGSVSPEALKRLDAIDAAILSSGSREIAGFLLQQVAKEIAETTVETGNASAALDNSLKLYQSLYDSVHYHIRLLQQALKRL